MQLVFDAADRLVELVEERRGAVPAEEAARVLFKLERAPASLARSLLEDVVEGDARLAWRAGSVAAAAGPHDAIPLDAARFVVVDVETTGLSPGRAALCEIGAVAVEGLEATATFQTLVDPGRPLPASIASLTGLADRDLRRGATPQAAVRRFLGFAEDAVVVAHNARFDLAFLDREVDRLTGRRLGGPVVDTAALARRLLTGRVARVSLASLAEFFGTSVRPCHRALPDAQATGEILVALIGLAQERGAETVADLCRLATPKVRRAHGKRTLVAGAPTRPGVYLFRGAGDQVLYVGRARDLRARLRSYFRSERQRPAVEAALAALERIEWRVTGSELEAALEELRLLRELRPAANARSLRPDRYLYLARRANGSVVVTQKPTELGPIRSRRRAELAARALAGGPLPDLRRRMRDHAECRRYEDAARLRDRIAALEQVLRAARELERLRAARLCLLAPALEDGFVRAFFVAGGRIAAVRTVPPGGGAAHELAAGLAEARRAPLSLAPEDADELLLVGSFLRRPPPELAVVDLRTTTPDGLTKAVAGYVRRHGGSTRDAR
jgi:DNA polymerase III epsilon subunit family exonuclease